ISATTSPGFTRSPMSTFTRLMRPATLALICNVSRPYSVPTTEILRCTGRTATGATVTVTVRGSDFAFSWAEVLVAASECWPHPAAKGTSARSAAPDRYARTLRMADWAFRRDDSMKNCVDDFFTLNGQRLLPAGEVVHKDGPK